MNKKDRKAAFMTAAILTTALCVNAAGSLDLKADVTSKEVTVDVGAFGYTDAGINKALATIYSDVSISNPDEYQLTVIIPEGTYELSHTLYVYPNTTIIANGSTFVRQEYSNETAYGAMIENIQLSENKNGDTVNNGADNITIIGGTWTCPVEMMSANYGVETFRFIHADNVNIKDAVFSNVPESSHLIVFAGVTNSSIDNCEFFGYGDNGDDVIKPKEAVQLDTVHSVIEVPTLQKDLVNWNDAACDNISITGCNFHDFSRGIGSHTAVDGNQHKNVTISNCSFKNITDSAVRLFNYMDTTVSKCSFEDVGVAVLAYTYIEATDVSYFSRNDGTDAVYPESYNINITDNTIASTHTIGSSLFGDGIRVMADENKINGKLLPITGVTINGNTIGTVPAKASSDRALDRYGIFASDAPGILITNNTINYAADNALILMDKCEGANISNNKIVDAGKFGIDINSCDSVTVSNNTINESANSALAVLDSSKVVLEKNTITKSGKYGIYTTNAPFTKINSNTISDSADNGIMIYDGSNNTSAASNKVTNSPKYGISVNKSGSVTLSKNTVTSSKDTSIIVLQSPSSIITGNTINKAGKYAISINQSEKCKVTSNKIDSSKDNSILIYDGSDSTTVASNKITKPNKYGISVNLCSGVTLSKNTITSSKDTSIMVLNSPKAKVSTNTINSAGKYAISINESEKCNVLSNKITTTKDHGIFVYGASDSTVVKSNNVTSAGKIGIDVNGASSVTVTNNTVTKSKGDGIQLYSAKKGTVTSNTVKTSGGYGIWIAKGADDSAISKNKISGSVKKDLMVTANNCTY